MSNGAANTRIGMPGVAVGLVRERDGQGRVRLEYPWLDRDLRSDWIPIASAMAGGGRGLFMMPEIGDEVLVAFQHGDFEHPVVVGFLWNGVDKPPADDPRERVICSKNGHRIRFIDSTPSAGDLGALVIEDAHGNRITLSNGKVSLSATAVLEIRAPVVTINGRVVQPSPSPI
ncbi:phage baseplate assembly protein V [Azospirillum largimobile]